MSIADLISKLPVDVNFLAAMQIDFRCLNCGKCCTDMAGIAYNQIDVARFCKHSGLSRKEFMKNHSTPSNRLKTDRFLKTKDNGTGHQVCEWREGDRCSQYLGRGQVCRFYPWFSPTNTSVVQAGKQYRIFLDCKGMNAHALEVFKATREVNRVQADKEMKEGFLERTGPILLLRMIADEGKDDGVLAAYKERGYDHIPSYEELRPLARKFALYVLLKFRAGGIEQDIATMEELERKKYIP